MSHEGGSCSNSLRNCTTVSFRTTYTVSGSPTAPITEVMPQRAKHNIVVIFFIRMSVLLLPALYFVVLSTILSTVRQEFSAPSLSMAL